MGDEILNNDIWYIAVKSAAISTFYVAKTETVIMIYFLKHRLVCLYIHTYVYTYMYVYVHIYMYMYIYTHISLRTFFAVSCQVFV